MTTGEYASAALWQLVCELCESRALAPIVGADERRLRRVGDRAARAALRGDEWQRIVNRAVAVIARDLDYPGTARDLWELESWLSDRRDFVGNYTLDDELVSRLDAAYWAVREWRKRDCGAAALVLAVVIDPSLVRAFESWLRLIGVRGSSARR